MLYIIISLEDKKKNIQEKKIPINVQFNSAIWFAKKIPFSFIYFMFGNHQNILLIVSIQRNVWGCNFSSCLQIDSSLTVTFHPFTLLFWLISARHVHSHQTGLMVGTCYDLCLAYIAGAQKWVTCNESLRVYVLFFICCGGAGPRSGPALNNSWVIGEIRKTPLCHPHTVQPILLRLYSEPSKFWLWAVKPHTFILQIRVSLPMYSNCMAPALTGDLS